MRSATTVVALSGLFLPPKADAAISVGATGSARWTFDAAPAATEWSTVSVGMGSGTITNAAQLDAAVRLLSATGFSNALPVTATYPPGENALARWNSNRQLLQTRPTSLAGSIMFTWTC